MKIVSGIYIIKNKKTNKIYVGSSNDIRRRWRAHRSLLKNNKHHSIYLQNAYNQYGKSCFEFIILKEVAIEKLLDEEQEIIKALDCLVPAGYNMTDSTHAPFAGCSHSVEAKKSQSEKNTGKNNYWYGKTLTEEHNSKISKSRKRYTDQEEKSFYLRLEGGEKLQSIANEQCVHPTTIRRAVDRYIRFKEEYDRREKSATDPASDAGTLQTNF